MQYRHIAASIHVRSVTKTLGRFHSNIENVENNYCSDDEETKIKL